MAETASTYFFFFSRALSKASLRVMTSLLRSTVLAFLRMFLHWSVILALGEQMSS